MSDNNYLAKVNGIEVKGNPFDVIMQQSIAYLRENLFTVSRLGTDSENLLAPTFHKSVVKNIDDTKEILRSMTKEQLEKCREESVIMKYAGDSTFIELNNFLFALEKLFPTVWTECTPAYDDSLEKIFYGDSSDYYRRSGLRETLEGMIPDNFKELNYDQKLFVFNSIAMLLNRCHELIDHDTNDKDHQQAKEFMLLNGIERGDNGRTDINFLQSVLSHLLRREYQITETILSDMRLKPWTKTLLDSDACKA